MDGITLLVLVIVSCFTACCGEYCSFSGYYGRRYCATGCCRDDCCRPSTTTHAWPQWTPGTTLQSDIDAALMIGLSFGVFLLVTVIVLARFYICQRPRRPPPENSQDVGVPMTRLEQGNPVRFQPPAYIKNPVWFIPSRDTEQPTMNTLANPQQQNSYPANTPASTVYHSASGNTNYNALAQNQRMGLQQTQYWNTNITQDAPPPYTDLN